MMEVGIEYLVCHHTTPDNVLIWFPENYIQDSEYYLQKVGISEKIVQDVTHLLYFMFVDCSYVQRFWNTKHVSDKINYNIKFTDFTIIFGSLINDQNSEPLNNLLLISVYI